MLHYYQFCFFSVFTMLLIKNCGHCLMLWLISMLLSCIQANANETFQGKEKYKGLLAYSELDISLVLPRKIKISKLSLNYLNVLK